MSAPAIPSLTLDYLTPSSMDRAAHAIAFGMQLDGALFVPVRQLGPAPLVEAWDFEDLIFGAVTAEETKPLEDVSREVYSGVIQYVREAGYPYFVRMWNFVGGINELASRERYQLFCAGRHDAFVEAGYHHDVDLPAASAVGMRARGLITYFLAARDAGEQVENPRQVAAYDYPPQYGPKSPSFSRATIWRDMVFVSGTSSVVGHQTVHAGDLEGQLDETIRNIEAVLGRTGRKLENVIAAKTYVRRAEDYAHIASRLTDVFPVNLYLEADICRKELLLEIECVAR